MTIKISVTAAGREFELTPEEARALYDELRQVYEPVEAVSDGFVSIPSVWDTETVTPWSEVTTFVYDNGTGQRTYTKTTGSDYLSDGHTYVAQYKSQAP